MVRPKSDWVLCQHCPHVEQTHKMKGELVPCRGYQCKCEKFEEKK